MGSIQLLLCAAFVTLASQFALVAPANTNPNVDTVECHINSPTDSRVWKRKASVFDQSALAGVEPYLNHQFYTSERQVMKGISYYGSSSRLRKLVADLLAGARPSVRLETIGGSLHWSITGLMAGVDDWFTTFKNWLASVSKVPVTGRNGCVPATTAAYTSVCQEAPTEPLDLVFIEYTPNVDIDDRVNDNAHVRELERLVQRVLNWPGRPAVVLVYSPHVSSHTRHLFYATMEDIQGSVSPYYTIPTISARPALHALWNSHTSNATTNSATAAAANASDACRGHNPLARQAVSNHIHRTISDLAVYLFQTVTLDLIRNPWTPAEDEQLKVPVPEPMYSAVVPATFSTCLRADAFKAAVPSAPGWTWENTGLDILPHWGFATSQPGIDFNIPLDSYLPSAVNISVAVFYTKTHAPMGAATVRCCGTCICDLKKADGFARMHVVLTDAVWLKVTRSPGKCWVAVQVAANSTTGGHRFMVTGVAVTSHPDNLSAPPLQSSSRLLRMLASGADGRGSS